MRKKRLLWQLYPSYLIITVVCLLSVSLYAAYALRSFYRDHMKDDLIARARLIQQQLPEKISTADLATIAPICDDLAERSETRITLILSSGRVLYDTEEDASKMDNHARRPEIAAALYDEIGYSIRYSGTLTKEMLYIAVPLSHPQQEKVAAVLRLSMPLISINQNLGALYGKITLGVLVIACVAAVVSLLVSRRLSSTLNQLKRGAERFAEGKLDQKLPVPESYEVGSVAESMNRMAEQLNERINTVVRQHNEQKAVLSSMVEGVVAVDMDEKIISLNRAAADMLGVERDQARGKRIQEVVRSSEMNQFFDQALVADGPIEGTVMLHDIEERFLKAHGTVLEDMEHKTIGALVVLNDQTHVRRLENIRREFVANVSHELKTPVTAIKGFVETLLDGAKDNPEDLDRFLEIITKQASRLNSIIEDLLTLSRIEQGSEVGQIDMEQVMIADILKAAALSCEVKASAKNISLNIECNQSFTAEVNQRLLEQAVVNLIDNAIKYSVAGSSVDIEVKREPDGMAINVRDYGIGIPEKHLPRLFERFYRVDKARSRDLGGTGLGLAIVKHIAQVHDGYATVESTPGKGSTFTIHLHG